MTAVKAGALPVSVPAKSKPGRVHYSSRAGAAAAYEMGVQVRGLCGLWFWPLNPAIVRLVNNPGDYRPSRNCRRCMAVSRARARHNDA